jgi:UDP-N-acetylmuramate dehydrogenase
MDKQSNVSLSDYTTMGLGGPAHELITVTTVGELTSAYQSARQQNLPLFILGGGSNVIAHDEGFSGLIIRIQITGLEIINDDKNTTTIKIGAGESWDTVVSRSVAMNLSGIEAMSAIPGTAGAAPVQNVGAYGQEIADTLQSLEAYDTEKGEIVILQNADCEFGYRDSTFRSKQKGRFIITSITIQLSKTAPVPPFYDALQRYLDDHQTTVFDAQTVRDAVIAIRANKLPDPARLPNSGSFFKNAVISAEQLNNLQAIDNTIPHFDMPGGHYKIPTGWLIEHAGLKGQLLHGIRVHDKNCLVLINESATSYADLAAARKEIISTVYDAFNVHIEQEPLEI